MSTHNIAFVEKILCEPNCSMHLSLTNLLVVKMLAVLVSTVTNSQVFLLKEC